MSGWFHIKYIYQEVENNNTYLYEFNTAKLTFIYPETTEYKLNMTKILSEMETICYVSVFISNLLKIYFKRDDSPKNLIDLYNFNNRFEAFISIKLLCFS